MWNPLSNIHVNVIKLTICKLKVVIFCTIYKLKPCAFMFIWHMDELLFAISNKLSMRHYL